MVDTTFFSLIASNKIISFGLLIVSLIMLVIAGLQFLISNRSQSDYIKGISMVIMILGLILGLVVLSISMIGILR